MPKLKTNKALAKRVRVTKTGKIKFSKPGRRHLMTCKNGKRRRQLRRHAYVQHPKFAKKYLSVIHNPAV